MLNPSPAQINAQPLNCTKQKIFPCDETVTDIDTQEGEPLMALSNHRTALSTKNEAQELKTAVLHRRQPT